MSDSRRTHRAIQAKLVQLQGFPSGRMMQRTTVLAAFVAGIVRSKSTQARKVAEQSGLSSKVESRIKQLERWYRNENVSYELEYLPYIEYLLTEFKDAPLVLAIDGSAIGRGCMALMINLIYENRAIPLVWTVFQRPKGHASVQEHIELLLQVFQVLSENQEVIFLGDGEFDGIELQQTIQAIDGWDYVCRTAISTIIHTEGEEFPVREIGISPGGHFSLHDVYMTHDAFGPVNLVGIWEIGYDQPLYLVTSLELADEAHYWYRRRASIETFFSDQKSRGFGLDKSHVSDPVRLFRILIAACLAYVWMIYLGVQAHRKDMVRVIHRTERCDLSLFQLGLSFLNHLLEESLPIDVGFRLPIDFLFGIRRASESI
ncbi:MAG: transposase [Caldilineaceae bacterium]|nr:transposase [Caldilineaceae bacterium]MCB9138816.1 transposase [Caldilineaceae bacterium]MCB9140137.1 transposase [Caldilineaceae bacterium]MCB9140356.1 transposase [Caldilineaceae bacterium]